VARAAKILSNYLIDANSNPLRAAMNIEQLPDSLKEFGRELMRYVRRNAINANSCKIQIKELNGHIHHDLMTGVYNRVFGMLTIDKWLQEGKPFVLIFADLDNLKYINDGYGHIEGDKYIINAAKYFGKFPHKDALVCRFGGDEFVLLVPDISYDTANTFMNYLCWDFQHDEYLDDKDYDYRISFGIAEVEAGNKMTKSEILSLADERMYTYKKMKKARDHLKIERQIA